MKFSPLTKGLNTVNATTTSGTNQTYVTNLGWYVPKMYTIKDYDDGNAPANVIEMQQYASYKERNFDRPFSVIFTPAVSVPVYKTGVTFGYGSKWKQWLDAADPNIPMYGLKYGIDSINLNQRMIYSVSTTYYFSCRTLR